jgi:hypothetical protein
MNAKTTPADFAALIRRAGLTLTEAQTAEVYAGWPYIEQMLDRLRGPSPRPREAEPAHIFVPLAAAPERGQ